MEKLRAEAEPILFRAAEVGARAAAQERADKFVAAARDAIGSWPDKKPWIEEKERKAVARQVSPYDVVLRSTQLHPWLSHLHACCESSERAQTTTNVRELPCICTLSSASCAQTSEP